MFITMRSEQHDLKMRNLQRLIRRLKSQGMKQKQVAADLGVEEGHLTEMLKGRRSITDATMNRLCRLYDLVPGYFFENPTEPLNLTDKEKEFLRLLRDADDLAINIEIPLEILRMQIKEKFGSQKTAIILSNKLKAADIEGSGGSKMEETKDASGKEDTDSR